MKAISHFCQGYSHLSSDKPCQDFALAESEGSLSMAIVSDGHGGDRYFRSDVGSKLIVEIAQRAIKNFVEATARDSECVEFNVAEQLFANAPFTQFSQSLSEDEVSKERKKVHEKLTWLFSSIIAQWNAAITEHAENNPLNEWEEAHVDEKYKAEFRNAEKDTFSSGDRFAKIYGCTLMAYVQTPKYWFAFHIGDGKLLTMSMHDDVPVFAQPVPWDEKCFLNKTTSICDSSALDEFRYCYCGDGSFPDAAFLGSDGLDDTYGDGALLEDFYMNVYLEIVRGYEKAMTVLESDLPEISRRGSKDDMSVACVYDESNLITNAVKILDYQLSCNSEKRKEVVAKIEELNQKLMAYEGVDLNEADRIQAMYIQKDIDKLTASLNSLTARRQKIAGRKGPFVRLLKATRAE